MKIDHVALYCKDLKAQKDFYCRYFNGMAGDIYHNPKTEFTSCFISFPDGGRLELMHQLPHIQPTAHKSRGYAHLCFGLSSKKAVDEMSRRVQEDGFAILSGPRMTGDGYYETCFLDPEGNKVEITI